MILNFQGAQAGANARALIEQLKRALAEAQLSAAQLSTLRVITNRLPEGQEPTANVEYLEDEIRITLGIPDGATGAPGKDFRYEDFTEEQLEALRGPAGRNGTDGHDGQDGKDGVSPQVNVQPIDGGYQVIISTETSREVIELMHGQNGQDGKDGNDGYSPTVQTEDIGDGYRVTITDKDGPKAFTIRNGKDGGTGDDGFSPSVTVEETDEGIRITVTNKDGSQSVDIASGGTSKTPRLWLIEGLEKDLAGELITDLTRLIGAEEATPETVMIGDLVVLLPEGAVCQVHSVKAADDPTNFLKVDVVGLGYAVAYLPYNDGTAAVAAHDADEAAHSYIQELIQALQKKVNAFLDVDVETADQLSELIALIEGNQDLIEAITTGKVSVSDIADNLTTDNAKKVLSAAQGVVLKGLIDGKLEASKLTEAINEALAQAKASGEFDGAPGEPGADGVSPTVSVEEITGGHRVSITDKDGTETFDVMDGGDGEPGAPGADGVSPSVSIEAIAGGHRVTITSKDKTESFDVLDGAKGDDGASGTNTGIVGIELANNADLNNLPGKGSEMVQVFTSSTLRTLVNTPPGREDTEYGPTIVQIRVAALGYTLFQLWFGAKYPTSSTASTEGEVWGRWGTPSNSLWTDWVKLLPAEGGGSTTGIVGIELESGASLGSLDMSGQERVRVFTANSGQTLNGTPYGDNVSAYSPTIINIRCGAFGSSVYQIWLGDNTIGGNAKCFARTGSVSGGSWSEWSQMYPATGGTSFETDETLTLEDGVLGVNMDAVIAALPTYAGEAEDV